MTGFFAFLLATVLYGQLGFNALIYYLGVGNPSWPIWISLYGLTAWVAIRTYPKLNIYYSDFLFLLFAGYVALSFAIWGESGAREFIFRFLMIIIAPYFCGRVLGKYMGLSLLRGLLVLFAIYVLMITREITLNPGLVLDTDRLRLFGVMGTDEGVSTAYNIGLNFGSAWVAVATYLVSVPKDHLTKAQKWIGGFILIGVPIAILTIGSRSSLMSMLLTVGIYVFLVSKFDKFKAVTLVAAAFAFLWAAVLIMPESRLTLLKEVLHLPSLVGSDASGCVLSGDSITARGTLFSEAIRFFKEAPVFGVGASNFGFRYCGKPEEFVSPHSVFLQVAADLGLVGILLLVLLIVSILRHFSFGTTLQKAGNQLAFRIFFALWLFMLVQIQISGNMYYDYHFFLLTGLFVSNLQNADRVRVPA